MFRISSRLPRAVTACLAGLALAGRPAAADHARRAEARAHQGLPSRLARDREAAREASSSSAAAASREAGIR